jgi:hypothetical protein
MFRWVQSAIKRLGDSLRLFRQRWTDRGTVWSDGIPAHPAQRPAGRPEIPVLFFTDGLACFHMLHQNRYFRIFKDVIIRSVVKEPYMGFQAFSSAKIKNLDVWDFGCVQGSVFFFTLLLASVLPALITLEWYWYLIPALILAVRPVYRVYKIH